MSDLKITLIGAGSYTWTPGVLSNLLGNPKLEGCSVVLHDINLEALELGHQLAQRYQQLSGSTLQFSRTLNLDAALEGADFVVVTVSTGGLQTMATDLAIPEKYGIYQTVGDTTGPGGVARALRNIPIFLQIAQAMERHCPEAWLLNLTNPLSALTQVVNEETDIRALGICHGVYGSALHFCDFFGVTLPEVAFVNTGLDHCSWFSSFRVKGQEACDLLEERGLLAWLEKPAAEAKEDPVFGALFDFRCGLLLGRDLGALPAIGDRHMCEFFPGFLQSEESIAREGLVRTTVAQRAESYAQARARIERMVKGEEQPRFQTATDVVGAHLTDDIAAWVLALSGQGAPYEDNMSAANAGQISALPLGAVVETRGLLDAAGCHPLTSPLPEQLEPIITPHVQRQNLVVEAGVEGDFEKAVAALATDPLLHRPTDARPMLREMLDATKEYLPQFGL